MDLLRPIIKHVTYPLFLGRDGMHPGPYRRLLGRMQTVSEDELVAFRLDRLKRLIDHCHEHNPFYRSRFSASGFEPRDLKSPDDLACLPVLTKDDIRSAGDALFSHGFDRRNTMHKRTGGSTGVPLHVYWNSKGVSFKQAGVERHNGWAGFMPGARLAAVWGDTDRPTPLKERIRNALTDRAFYLDTLKFDEAHIEKFISLIEKYRPEILMGHAHSVFRLAEYVRDRNRSDLRFQGIITTAMVLHDTERKVIEDVFSSSVFNRYGSEETSLIASECPAHQGMHIFAEGLYLELEGRDETVPRRLIVTDLVNLAMPLIRYEIGDYAVALPGKCACGRTLPRLKEVSGRTADFLYTPDRVPVFGISILDTFVIHIPGLKQVQIIQDRYDHLLFRIVKSEDFGPESLDRLKKNVTEIFGPRMRYDLAFVDRIELTERGKFRFSICRIEKEAASPADGGEA